jgi:formamidopyrimidine-DNA glycosylase
VPELAEVEMVRRGLRILEGCTVVVATAARYPKFTSARLSTGQTWHRITRHGKWLAVELDTGWLQLHLGMAGRLDLTAPGGTPAPLTHVHATFRFDDGHVLRFSDPRRFGRVRFTVSELDGIDVGPEPGSPDARAALSAAIARRSTPVFLTLLDQTVCAGVGSYLAQEALWRAKVAPHASSLSAARVGRLSDALAAVVADAISYGGVSMRDYVHVDGSRGSMQDRLECYGRSGEECSRCGTLMSRQTIGGRGVTWCRRCQR